MREIEALIEKHGLDGIAPNIRAALLEALRGDNPCMVKDWCCLKPGHEGGCTPKWEKELKDKIQSFDSYRGRRLYACHAMGDFERAIDRLGIEDGSDLPIPGQGFNPRPSDQVIAELKNQARSLLRLVLILNDGRVSADSLNSF